MESVRNNMDYDIGSFKPMLHSENTLLCVSKKKAKFVFDYFLTCDPIGLCSQTASIGKRF